MKIHRQIVLLLCLFCWPLPYALADGEQIETTFDLNELVAKFIEDYSHKMAAKGYRTESQLGNIDPRLAMRNCEKEVGLQFRRAPIEQSQATIEVTCTDDTPWRLYVSSQIAIFGPAVVAAQPIARGQMLDHSNLSIAEAQVNMGRADIISTIEDAEGMIARRSIPAGQQLSSRVLRAPELVDKGDQVTIVAEGSAIAIRTTGTALASGSYGEQIRVRNNHSDRVIRAHVIDRGKVAIVL